MHYVYLNSIVLVFLLILLRIISCKYYQYCLFLLSKWVLPCTRHSTIEDDRGITVISGLCIVEYARCMSLQVLSSRP